MPGPRECRIHPFSLVGRLARLGCTRTGSPGIFGERNPEALSAVTALAVAPDGRIVSAWGDRRLRLWDPDEGSAAAEMACLATAISFAPINDQGASRFAVAHEGHGISLWSLRSR